MIKLTTGAPGQGMSFDIPTASESPNMIGWQNVHALAVQSMVIVVGRNPAPAAWAFKVDVVDFGDVSKVETAHADRASAAPHASAKPQIVPPVGNTGGTFLRGVNRV